MRHFRLLEGTGAVLGLLPIAALAILIHGYHLGVDDAAIYLPAIKKAADAGLYPFGTEFFMSHAHLSLFPDLVGGSARLTRLPVDLVIFLWHATGVFLLLLAAWRVACACFASGPARWGAVALTAGFLSVPVAGTALVVMDPYLTARSLSTPATILAIAALLSHQPRRCLAWLLFTACIHPQMAVYGVVFLGCLLLYRQVQLEIVPVPPPLPVALSALPFLFSFQPAQGAAREALYSRTFFFVSQWEWYEWMGILAPLGLLAWFASLSPRRATPAFRRVAATLVPFGLLFTAAGLVLTLATRLENYARLQPMRAFHLLYVLLFILVGGLLGEYVLGPVRWRWAAFVLPLAAAMWLLQRSEFPASAHVEWPGTRDGNAWTNAFLWIRGNTPRNAVFALDPEYLHLPGEDQHGFRAVAERSVLADNLKDSGAVSMFPALAGGWKEQVVAQAGWTRFRRADFEHLATLYPVTWIVTRPAATAGMECPYASAELAVCQIGVHR
jgi:hypothetical protein